MKRNSHLHNEVNKLEADGYQFFNASKKVKGIKMKVGVFAINPLGVKSEIKPTLESLLKLIEVSK